MKLRKSKKGDIIEYGILTGTIVKDKTTKRSRSLVGRAATQKVRTKRKPAQARYTKKTRR
jgi:hypothetical protein